MEALRGLVPAAEAAAIPRGVDPEVWKSMVPADNAPTPERLALGRKLYFETALSKDGTVSCATCHDVTRSFTDRRPASEGVGGQIGKRNSPTTMNAALLHTQFWDGRSRTLEDQAAQPILNPVEMAMPSREAAVQAVARIPGYKEMFRAAYGRDINYDDIARAIAVFERTLVFLDSPFDRFLAGDASAISADARAGWELYNGKARCVTCHPITGANPLGTDNRFHNIGVSAEHRDFESLARRALKALAEDPSERKLDELAVGTDLSELGRFMVTRRYADIGSFRTPQVRNAGITAPYMHDGSLETLWDVMDHYNAGGDPNPYLDGGIEALALSEREIDQVVALMFSMTDDRFRDLNRKELERQRAQAARARPERETDRAFRKVLWSEQGGGR
jgi:cytochrome c peroxidase